MNTNTTRYFWKPPQFDNEETQRIAKVIYGLSISIGAASLIGFLGVIFVFEEKLVSSFAITIFLIAGLTAYVLSRYEYIRASSVILLATFWLTTLSMVALSGGMHSLDIIFFVTGTTIAGLLLGQRGTLYYGSASIMAGIAFLVLDAAGITLPNLFPFPARTGLILLLVNLALLIPALNTTLTTLHHALEQAHQRLDEQQKMQEELRSSEEKFSKAFHASPMALIIQRVSDKKYADVNEGFTRITGYTHEEALEHTINELNLYPDKEISARMSEQLRKNGFVRDFEIPFRRKNGEIGYGLVWGEPIEIDGKLMAIGGTIDITERKRAEESIQQSVIELATVNAVSQVANSQLELSKMIELTGEKLRQLQDIHSLFIALYDDKDQVIRLPYYRVYDKITTGVEIPFGQGLSTWVIQNHQSLVINHHMEQKSAELGAVRINTPDQTYQSPKSWMGLPIQAGGQVLGVLAIQNFEREYAFTDDSQRFWETIVANLGVAIQNAQLYAAAQQEITERKRSEAEQAEQAWEISTLYEALSAITALHGDAKFLSQKITDIIVKQFHAHKCALFLISDNGSRLTRITFSGQEVADDVNDIPVDSPGLVTFVLKSGQSEYVPDVTHDPRYVAWDESTRSEFIVPLQAYGETIGIINMESPVFDDFSERTRRLVLAFAQNATLALQNANLLDSLEESISELRESQSRINFFLEHTAEGVYRIDYDPPIPTHLPIEKQFKLSVEYGKIAECNAAFAQMYGFILREEMLGRPYIEFYGEEGIVANMEGNLEFYRQGYKIDDFETEEFNARGEKVYFANNVVGIIRDGYFVSTWGTQRDITPLKKALAEKEKLNKDLEKNLGELKDAQARFNYFIEHTSEGVYRVDYNPPIPIDLPFEEQFRLTRERGEFGECNLAIAKMYGYSTREEMLAAPYYANEEGYEASLKANIGFYRNGYKTDDSETEEYTPSGEKAYFLNNAVGIIRDGYFMGIWGTQRDITPLKKVLAELENRNAELERFNYTLSHELKTPIVSIRGFLGFLENDMKSGNMERARNDFDRIANAANKMYKMINELLELSRIGRIINPPVKVPFEEIVLSSLNNVEELIKKPNVQVRIQPDMPTVYVDFISMDEVIQNLVENAVKYMGDQPDPQITIGVRSGGGENVFFISDNGMGINPEYHERVFNIFEKLNPQSEGTGIGLALVKRIIETHGGRIWVESEGNGKGTTFCFTLPTKD